MSGSRKRDALGLPKGAGRTSKDGGDLAIKVKTHIEALENTPHSDIAESLKTKILMKESRDSVDRLHASCVKTKQGHANDLNLTKQKVLNAKKYFASNNQVDEFARYLRRTAKDEASISRSRAALHYFKHQIDYNELKNRPNNYKQANIFESAYTLLVTEETRIISEDLDSQELEGAGDYEPGLDGFAISDHMDAREVNDVCDDITVEL